MLRLKDRMSGVPDGHRFYIAEVGLWVRAPHWPALIAGVRDALIANHLEVPPDLENQIEEQLAAATEKVAPYLVHDAKPDPLFERRGLKMSDVYLATLRLADWVLHGRQVVDIKEANRRADICVKCEWNVDAEPCSICRVLREQVEKLVPEQTAAHGKLKVCFDCGCLNSTQVWFPVELLQKHQSAERNAMLPTHCWKKRTEGTQGT